MKFWSQAPPPLGDSVRPGRYHQQSSDYEGFIGIHPTQMFKLRDSPKRRCVFLDTKTVSFSFFDVFGWCFWAHRGFCQMSGPVAQTCEIFRSSLERRWADVHSPSRNDRSCWDPGRFSVKRGSLLCFKERSTEKTMKNNGFSWFFYVFPIEYGFFPNIVLWATLLKLVLDRFLKLL